MVVVEEAEAEVIEEIPEQITVKVMVKITIKIIKAKAINNRSILVREILTEVTIEVAETIIRTGEKVVEETGVEEEAEFKVDGIKEAIIPAQIIINAAAIIEAEVDNIEFRISF